MIYKKLSDIIMKTSKKRMYLICGSIFFFVILLVCGYLAKPLYDVVGQIGEETGISLTEVIGERANKVLRIVDEINIFRLKKNLLDESMPVYNLQFSVSDIEYFNLVSKESVKRGYLVPELNEDWKKAKLTVDGEVYDVKVRLHGDFQNHWENHLKSYKIKLNDNSVDSMSEFNLIIFEDRQLSGRIARMIANDLGLFNIRDDIITLKINGVPQGLYYLQEKIDADFFEKNKCPGCVLIKTTDNYLDDHPRNNADKTYHGVFKGPDHGTFFDDEISNLNFNNNANPQILQAVNNLFAAIDEGDADQISRFFNLDQISSFEALRWIVGTNHFIRGDNLNLAYDTVSGLFYPVPKVESLGILKVEQGGIEHNLNLEAPMFKLIAKNKEIRHLRNKKVYSYVSDNQQILVEIDKMSEFYYPYSVSYKTNVLSSWYTKYRLKRYQEAVRNNFEIIKNNLEYSKTYLNIFQKGNIMRIEVLPDSIAEIKFDNLLLELAEEYDGTITFKYTDERGKVYSEKGFIANSSSIDMSGFTDNLYFSAGLDEQMYPIKQRYVLEILFDNADKVLLKDTQISMMNDITKKMIPAEDTYIQIADGNDYYPERKTISFDEFRLMHPQFNWEFLNGELILRRGAYTVDENLIIPAFTRFNIEDGTVLSLSGGVSIVSYSPLSIHGTSASPVIIRALDEKKPFGTFGIIGSGKEKTTISWLDLSGGSEKFINGIFFSGGLSIHYMDVDMHDSIIHHNHADDGLNIKYGDVSIGKTSFYSNFADQFDCDFCKGVIENSHFEENLQDADDNGDGLDFSGSQVIVKGNIFLNFKDKGVSIGENTDVILSQNLFQKNNMGAAVKDKSHAFFIDNTFEGNNIAIYAYQKKPIFGGGNAYFHENRFITNVEMSKKDGLSHLYNINLQPYDKDKLYEAVLWNDVDGAFMTVEKYKVEK